jgi:hypothetical protein
MPPSTSIVKMTTPIDPELLQLELLDPAIMAPSSQPLEPTQQETSAVEPYTEIIGPQELPEQHIEQPAAKRSHAESGKQSRASFTKDIRQKFEYYLEYKSKNKSVLSPKAYHTIRAILAQPEWSPPKDITPTERIKQHSERF